MAPENQFALSDNRMSHGAVLLPQTRLFLIVRSACSAVLLKEGDGAEA
jgi:hypothetical protein